MRVRVPPPAPTMKTLIDGLIQEVIELAEDFDVSPRLFISVICLLAIGCASVLLIISLWMTGALS